MAAAGFQPDESYLSVRVEEWGGLAARTPNPRKPADYKSAAGCKPAPLTFTWPV
jgi:hypothetical protein